MMNRKLRWILLLAGVQLLGCHFGVESAHARSPAQNAKKKRPSQGTPGVHEKPMAAFMTSTNQTAGNNTNDTATADTPSGQVFQKLARHAAGNRSTPLFWLHVPKTGTSFEVSTRLYPQHTTRIMDRVHQSLNVTWDDDQIKHTVTIMREPAQRLLSSFYYVRQEKLCCFGDWGWTKWQYQALKAGIKKARKKPGYVAGLTGCMTRMVLGYGCWSMGLQKQGSSVSTKQDAFAWKQPRIHTSLSKFSTSPPRISEIPHEFIDVAKERLDRFLFVGIQSEWRKSMCLFNHIMTGERFVYPDQLAFITPGTLQSTLDEDSVKLVTKQPRGYNPAELGKSYKDTADSELYEHAVARFNADCAARGINSDEDCPIRNE